MMHARLGTSIVLIASLIFIAVFYVTGYADTVYLKDGGSLKGIVVEDYIDRIIYSTADGEKELLKGDIQRIEFDEPIDNLISLGDSAFQKGYHAAALKYYLMAQEINPEISDLNNKIYHTEGVISKTPEVQEREYLALKNEVISGRESPPKDAEGLTPQEALQRELGISIYKKEGRFYIKDLKRDSSFKEAGAKKGDVIIAIWSKLCGYLTYENIYDLLTNPAEAMIAATIERDLTLDDDGPFGAELVIKWEGAVVDAISKGSAAEKAGLKIGDQIAAVGGESIRYTPLRTVLERLQKRDTSTSVTIRRKLTIFKSS